MNFEHGEPFMEMEFHNERSLEEMDQNFIVSQRLLKREIKVSIDFIQTLSFENQNAFENFSEEKEDEIHIVSESFTSKMSNFFNFISSRYF